MKVKVLRDYYGAEGQTRSGQILEISQSRFNQLTTGIHKSHPLVAPMEVGYKMMEAPLNKMIAGAPRNKEAAESGDTDPTDTLPAGGLTGEESGASLLQPDRQPMQKTSSRRRARRRSSP